MKRSTAAACIAMLLVATGTRTAAAAQRARPRFEPTDLDLQGEGVVQIDTQTGYLTGEDGRRRYTPDFEATLGLSSQVELEIDGAFGFDASSQAQMLENTLIALRIQMLDVRDSPTSTSAWAAGVQIGPRLPTALGTHGIGIEALGIVGRTAGRMHLYLQGGTILDPFDASPGTGAVRPFGIEGGLDLDLDLDDKNLWSVKGELSGVKFLSPNNPQLHLTAGPAVNVVPWLELSVIGVLGFLSGGDRFGLLFGATAQFHAF